MKKFRFSLDSVLKLRQHETELARLALSRAVHRRRKQEAIVQEARQERDAVMQRGRQQTTVSPLALQQRLHAHEAASQTLDEAQRVLRRLQLREKEARAELTSRHHVEASFQMLHDEEKQRYRLAQDEAEAKFLDDQAVSQYARRQQTA